MKGINVSKGFAFNPGIIKYLKKSDFDFLVIGGYSSPTSMLTIEYCRRKKIPFIINADGGIIKNENKVFYKIKKRYISSARAWLSTGENTLKYLEYYGAKKEKIMEYPFTSISEKDILTRPISKNEKRLLKKDLNLDEKLTAIAVGSFINRKGFDILIDSWKNVSSEFNLLIIGGGEEKENLQRQIKRLKIKNITLVDFKNPEELTRYYKSCDLFILPTRRDVWGLVVNEAMACGLPIITSDKCIAGLEMIEEEINGFVFPLEDRSILTKRIEQILFDNTLSWNMQINNIKKIELYTFEKMAQKHIEIFKNLHI